MIRDANFGAAHPAGGRRVGRHGTDDVLSYSLETPINGAPATAGNGVHIAFAVDDRATVDRFYHEALRLGGTDAGAPGLRPQYGPTYYGAFVFDPGGNKIEAVTGL